VGWSWTDLGTIDLEPSKAEGSESGLKDPGGAGRHFLVGGLEHDFYFPYIGKNQPN